LRAAISRSPLNRDMGEVATFLRELRD